MGRRLGRKQLGAAVGGLLAAESVYIAAHIMPDGDAVGSMLGLGTALSRLGKACTLACADPVPPKFDYVDGFARVVSRPPTTETVIISVDSSDIERLGSLYDAAIFASRPVINIDHHVTNTGYGSINLVQVVPSTAEIVLSLVKRLGVKLDRSIATALLTGLVTDTRCFRTGNVTSRQLRVALELTRSGASLAEVTELIFNREPIATVCLWGRALANVGRRGRILWTEIDRRLIGECQAAPNDDKGLVSFLASRADVDVAIVFRETDDGRIEASMRSGPGWDVSRAALQLGGGGHPRAAGCTRPGPMASAREFVLSRVAESLEAQEAARAEESH